MSSGDDALVRDAWHRLRSAPEVLQRHSLRMAALADMLADREHLHVDRAGMFCACTFHDLGLLVAGRAPFPVRSAGLLEVFLAEHDVAPSRAQPLVTAVRRHLLPPVSAPQVGGRRGSARHTVTGTTPPVEVALLRRVAWLDALAVGDAEARLWRREMRTADGDHLLDAHLGVVLGAACARDLMSGVRTAAARVLPTYPKRVRVGRGRRAVPSTLPA